MWYGKTLNITYIDNILASPDARQHIRYLTINGTDYNSMVIPSGLITGVAAKLMIEAPLGYPTEPVVYAVHGCNFTSVSWDADLETLTVSTNRGGGGTGLLYVYSPSQPNDVEDCTWYSWDPATKLITISVEHSSPATVTVVYREMLEDWRDAQISNLQFGGLAIFTMIAAVIIMTITGGQTDPQMVLQVLLGAGAVSVVMWVIGYLILRF
jgi:hypothetical protein